VNVSDELCDDQLGKKLDELCDDQLGKQLCLESVPTGILGIRHVRELSVF
jgi:hypothetical protein